MTKKDFTYGSKDGITTIHAIRWTPDGEVKAVLQIAHGMVEFIDRYDRFAVFLAEHGICVVGNDHLGHGESVISEKEHGFFAEKDGNACVIGDMHTLRTMTQERYPDVPYFLLGHSMGSFLARQYIEMHGEGLAGAVIMGTGYMPENVLKAGMRLCRSIARVRGWKHRSRMVHNIALGSNNKKFEPARTKNDWLTRDEAIVDAYCGNPWNNFVFTVNGYYNMFFGIEYCQKEENLKKIPKDLPILVVSGGDDPVGNFGEGPRKVADIYVQMGIEDVQLRVYSEFRHEILNEINFDVVDDDILSWMLEKGGQEPQETGQ